jgi:hypothetical protein
MQSLSVSGYLLVWPLLRQGVYCSRNPKVKWNAKASRVVILSKCTRTDSMHVVPPLLVTQTSIMNYRQQVKVKLSLMDWRFEAGIKTKGRKHEQRRPSENAPLFPERRQSESKISEIGAAICTVVERCNGR